MLQTANSIYSPYFFVSWLCVMVTIACKMSFDMLLAITVDDLDTSLLLDVHLLW